MYKKILPFLLILAPLSSEASIFDSFYTCDQRWGKAWATCNSDRVTKCTNLLYSDVPDCEPSDIELKNFSNGKIGKIRSQIEVDSILETLINEFENVEKKLAITDWNYKYISNPYGAPFIKLSAKINNYSNQILNRVEMKCNMSFNDKTREETFSEKLFFLPNLISKKYQTFDSYIHTPASISYQETFSIRGGYFENKDSKYQQIEELKRKAAPGLYVNSVVPSDGSLDCKVHSITIDDKTYTRPTRDDAEMSELVSRLSRT
jgi:hypothetical protein